MLAHPNVVTVTFANDAEANQLEGWGDWAVTSDWLSTVGGDYGVGRGSHIAKVRLSEPAPASASESDLQAFVASHMASGALPMPLEGIVYLLYFPDTTTLQHDGEIPCTDFSGYHSEASIGSASVPFAAIGRCPAYWPGLDELQNVERTASHELIEAATNPFPSSNPAYDIKRDGSRSRSTAWAEAEGEGEVGDLCAGTQLYEEDGFIAQRIWSNSAASARGDPCVPAETRPFFSVSAPNSDWYAIAPGATITIPLVGWSSGTVPDWVVRSRAQNKDFTVQTSSSTTIETGSSTYATTNNRRSLSVTVTAPADAPSGTVTGIEVRSLTPTADASPDATREDSYHYAAVGVYVP